MSWRKPIHILAIIVILSLVTLSCGSGPAPKPTNAPEKPPEEAVHEEPTPEPETAEPTATPQPTTPPPTATPEPPAEQVETEAPAVEDTVAAEEAQPAPTEAAPAEYNTPFPLPDDVTQYLDTTGDGLSINFQTKMTIEESVKFYQTELAAMGLTERTLLTVIQPTVFSIVYDGWEDGRSVVVQGTTLGATTNINIRLEKA